MAKDGFAGNPDVYTCITIKQNSVAGIPIELQRVASDGTIQVVKDLKNPYYKLLQRPNPYESWPRFIGHVVGDLQYSGDAYIERVGPTKDEHVPPKELNVLPPAEMRILRGNKQVPVSGYEWGPDIFFEPWQICHIKLYNPLDYFYGLSPLSSVSRAIEQNNAASLWNYNLLKNMGRPSGILTVADEVADEASFEEMRKKLHQQYEGSENAGRPMLLTGDMKWTQMGLNPAEMDFRMTYAANTRKICSAFGVPPQLVGELENRTYSNYGEARVAFYKETILPLMDWLLAEFDAWLTPLFGKYLLTYDKSAVEGLQEDTNARYDRILRAVAGGVLAPNEGRAVLGYDPVDNGDTRLIPLNLAPADVWEDIVRQRMLNQNAPQPAVAKPAVQAQLPAGEQPTPGNGQNAPQQPPVKQKKGTPGRPLAIDKPNVPLKPMKA
jgi:HK97 family phage portal protein